MGIPATLSSVPNQTPYIQYVATNGQTVFPYPFVITQDADLIVVPNGATLPTDSGYTLSGVGNSTGGNVTFTAGRTAGDIITLYRSIGIQRISQIAQNSGFSSALFNAEYNNIYLILQQLQESIALCLQIPNTNNPAPATMLTPGNYANKYLAFDANGNPTPAALTSSGALTAAIIGTLLNGAQTPAELAGSIVPTAPQYLPGDIRRYGATTAASDNAAAFISAAAQATQTGGAPISIPPGSFNLVASSLPIALGPNVKIQGSGKLSSKLVVTGGTAATIFTTLNVGGIELRDFSATGLGTTPDGSAGAVYWHTQTTAATAQCTRFKVINCSFTNFGSDYWLYWQNLGNTYPTRDIEIAGCDFTSAAGNAKAPASILELSSCIGIYGSITGAAGFISDVNVHDNVADGTFIKNFCIFWSSVFRGQVHHNKIKNFGTDAGFSPDVARYALLCYNFAHSSTYTPDLIDFSDNVIDGCGDCGIYFAGAGRLNIANNEIRGQLTSSNAVLPKGCIAGNDCALLTLDNNRVSDSVFGIQVTPGQSNSSGSGTFGDVYRITNTRFSNITGSCLILSPSGGEGTTIGAVEVDGFTIQNAQNASCNGINITGTSASGLKSLIIRNGRINNPSNAIVLTSIDATVVAMGATHISDVEIVGIANGGTGLSWAGCSNAASRTTIEGITFVAPAAGAQCLVVNSSINLTIRDITFQDMTTGATFCWYGTAAQGVVTNVNFVNVAAARRYSTSADLGAQIPGWTGNDNDYVQNFNPTIAGTGGFGTVNQKHWTAGWCYDVTAAAWNVDMRLTGA